MGRTKNKEKLQNHLKEFKNIFIMSNPEISIISSTDSKGVKRSHDNEESSGSSSAKKAKTTKDLTQAELAALPTRQYLDKTVVPILLDVLAILAKERPSDPVGFLIESLQKRKQDMKQKTK